MRCRSRRPGLRRFLSLAVGACVLAWSSSASGYRPFVSTDAAVADPKEIEIELGYFTLERTKDENTFIIPRAVVNYGLFKNWEAVAEFAIQRAPDAEMDVIDPAISLKGVLKEGVLQDKEGLGLAVEASALLPSTEKGEGRFGFEGIAILSDKLGPFTFHLNGGLGIERSTGDLVGIWGVIGELPVAKGVRLVGEVNGEKPRREDQRDSALLGIIWQPWSEKNVWFDAGIRRGFTSAAPDWQFTLGITFSFTASSAATSPAPQANCSRDSRELWNAIEFQPDRCKGVRSTPSLRSGNIAGDCGRDNGRIGRRLPEKPRLRRRDGRLCDKRRPRGRNGRDAPRDARR